MQQQQKAFLRDLTMCEKYENEKGEILKNNQIKPFGDVSDHKKSQWVKII